VEKGFPFKGLHASGLDLHIANFAGAIDPDNLLAR
jgi:hypothetical protein